MVEKLTMPGRYTPPESPRVSSGGNEAEIARLAKQAWADVMRECGRQYGSATLDSFQLHGSDEDQNAQSETLGVIREYCNQMPRNIEAGHGVVMLGPCGTGKDHLMIGMVRRAIQAGCHSVKWADAAEFYGECKDALGIGVSPGEVLKAYIAPQLLVLSEITPGNDALRDFESEMLFRLIHARWRRLRTTWVNANATDRADIAAKVPEKILSRLGHGALVLQIAWPDYRRKVA